MSTYTDKGDLTKGDIPHHLIRLSIPMIWGIMAIISYQLVDTFYLSLLGTQQLAAIGYTYPVTMFVFSLIMGFSIATSSVVSRQIGEGGRAVVKRLVTHSIIIATLAGSLIAGIGLFIAPWLFHTIGARGDILELVLAYIIIWLPAGIGLAIPMVGNAAIRAGGDTTTPAIIMMAAAALNIVLDPLLIFGPGPFPQLGIQGAAIATLIANGITAIAALIILTRKGMLSPNALHLSAFGNSCRRILAIALPVALTNVMQPVTNAVLIAILAGFGHAGVAAYGVAIRIEAFAFIVIMALATGMAPLIGQNIGARLYDRLHQILRLAMRFAVGWSLFIALLLGLFAAPIAGIFTDDAEIARIMQLYFLIIPISYIPGNLVPGWASAFNAMGMPGRTVMMLFVRMFVLMIPLGFLGAWAYEAEGMFFGIAASNVIAGTVFHFWNRKWLADRTVSTLS